MLGGGSGLSYWGNAGATCADGLRARRRRLPFGARESILDRRQIVEMQGR
jgi:hypothetical protein